MAELIILTVFVILTMVMVMGFCLYVIRIVLGVSGKSLPDSAEIPFSSLPEGGAELSDYLDRMGGGRFTSPATFPVDRTSTDEVMAEDYPDGTPMTAPSETPIS